MSPPPCPALNYLDWPKVVRLPMNELACLLPSLSPFVLLEGLQHRLDEFVLCEQQVSPSFHLEEDINVSNEYFPFHDKKELEKANQGSSQNACCVWCRLQGENEQNNELDSAGLGGLADSLMHHLLSKDVLYQPMKDIGERYPAWLAAHRLDS
jgi:hypothetical protein